MGIHQYVFINKREAGEEMLSSTRFKIEKEKLLRKDYLAFAKGRFGNSIGNSPWSISLSLISEEGLGRV
jgi:hypothetical protein